MSKRIERITHTFKQNYDNWSNNQFFSKSDANMNTYDILEALDLLEKEVLSDRDYNWAYEMINSAKAQK